MQILIVPSLFTKNNINALSQKEDPLEEEADLFRPNPCNQTTDLVHALPSYLVENVSIYIAFSLSFST